MTKEIVRGEIVKQTQKKKKLKKGETPSTCRAKQLKGPRVFALKQKQAKKGDRIEIKAVAGNTFANSPAPTKSARQEREEDW